MLAPLHRPAIRTGALALALCCPATALADADATYLDALAAWGSGDWAAALVGARDALAEDPNHAAAALLQGYALVRLGELELGSDALRAMADDPWLSVHEPAVAALAQRYARNLDQRWRRDQPTVAAGLAFRSDRDPYQARYTPTLAVSARTPVSTSVGVLFDVVAPAPTFDALSLGGPVVSVLGSTTLATGNGTWHVDIGAGPSVWVGSATAVDHPVQGLFPGLRGAAGLSVRPHRRVGARAEIGWTVHAGARKGVDDLSMGPELRLMATGWPR